MHAARRESHQGAVSRRGQRLPGRTHTAPPRGAPYGSDRSLLSVSATSGHKAANRETALMTRRRRWRVRPRRAHRHAGPPQAPPRTLTAAGGQRGCTEGPAEHARDTLGLPTGANVREHRDSAAVPSVPLCPLCNLNIIPAPRPMGRPSRQSLGHLWSPWGSVLQGGHGIYRGHKEAGEPGWLGTSGEGTKQARV